MQRSDQPAPPRSARFYQGSVAFEIEGTLYRITKQGFERYSQSFFRTMFSLPQGPEGSREGDSDENPIRAPQVTKGEFDSLLEVIYPLALEAWPPKLSKEQWVGVLRLSRQWDMPKIAALAIGQLSDLNLSVIEKVKLGKAHGVPQWLKDGYTTLVGDMKSASLEDLKSLGLDTAIRILYAQNQTHVLEKKNNLYCGYCHCYGNGQLLLQYHETGQFAGTYRCDTSCGRNPQTSGHGALAIVDVSGFKSLTNSSVARKVAEVFKDEIEEAERRSTLSPA